MDSKTQQTKKFSLIETKRDWNLTLNRNFGKIIALYFWADWNTSSIELKDIQIEYQDSYELDSAIFGLINTDKDDMGPICEEFNIESVPACILIDSDKNVLYKFDEVNPGVIFQTIEEQTHSFRQKFETEKTKMFMKLDIVLKQNPVAIFIKGTQKNPECGFSRKILEALDRNNIIYQDLNVFTEGYRNWVKEYSDWQTIPQLYINGKCLGGQDALLELEKEDKLMSLIPKGHLRFKPEDMINKVLSDSRVVLFTTSDKNNRESWGRSNLCMKYLGENGVLFTVYDEYVQEGAKNVIQTLSKVEDFPQLWLDQNFLKAGKDLEDALQKDIGVQKQLDEKLYMENVDNHLKKLISQKNVMLFIKGTPDMPQCGFSSTLLQIIDKLNIDYGYFNILKDPLVRERLKVYSQWNTYPQVYVEGDLVGGQDIVKEMLESGDFQDMVAPYVRA